MIDLAQELNPAEFLQVDFIDIQSFLILSYHYLGDNIQANQLAESLLDQLAKKTISQRTEVLKGRILNFQAITVWQMGDLDSAFNLNLQAMQLLKKNNNYYDLSAVYNTQGMFFALRNNKTKALYYYNLIMNCSELQTNKLAYAATLHNLANIYTQQDKISEAIMFYKQSLAISTQLGNIMSMAFTYHKLGRTVYKIGDIEHTTTYYTQALNLRKKLGNPNHIVATLLYLILIEFEENGYTEKLQKYNDEIQSFVKHSSDPPLIIRSWLSQAVVYLASPRVLQKFMAKPLLEKVIAKCDTYPQLQIYALLQLIQLLYYEALFNSENSETLAEFSTNLERIKKVQRVYQSKSLEIEIMIYNANYAILNQELTIAERLLSKAVDDARDNSFPLLEKKAQIALDLLQEQVHAWRQTLAQNARLLENIKNQELKNYLNEVKKLKFIL